ncbi:hypothetical protein TGDOM2_359760, partial [Toxoplasma gondii GAB2-2007-GAL-DOM2]
RKKKGEKKRKKKGEKRRRKKKKEHHQCKVRVALKRLKRTDTKGRLYLKKTRRTRYAAQCRSSEKSLDLVKDHLGKTIDNLCFLDLEEPQTLCESRRSRFQSPAREPPLPQGLRLPLGSLHFCRWALFRETVRSCFLQCLPPPLLGICCGGSQADSPRISFLPSVRAGRPRCLWNGDMTSRPTDLRRKAVAEEKTWSGVEFCAVRKKEAAEARSEVHASYIAAFATTGETPIGRGKRRDRRREKTGEDENSRGREKGK